MMSLNRRLLLATSIVLTLFLGAMGFVLDRAFKDSVRVAVRDGLEGQINALLGYADLNESGVLVISETLAEARYATPQSGLYARIIDSQGNTTWRSASILDLDIPFGDPPPLGIRKFEQLEAGNGVHYFSHVFSVAWEGAEGTASIYTVQVAESQASYNARVSSYRRSLWGWLSGITLVLLALQGSILRWGLSPLRKVEQDLEGVKSGQSDHLTGVYPRELTGLTGSINSFIVSERSQKERYRNTLGDLAHSLKTPLAVLRGAFEGQTIPLELRESVQEQVARMTQIVDYQLQRAATTGRTLLAAPVNLSAIVNKLVKTLDKVYAEKNIRCHITIDDTISYQGDEGDMLEMLGNILDNAYKFATTKVSVTVSRQDDNELHVLIDDDGPGIPEGKTKQVLHRGIRVDERAGGQGIGLDVVRDIIEVYGGRISISRSAWGGASIRIILPVS